MSSLVYGNRRNDSTAALEISNMYLNNFLGLWFPDQITRLASLEVHVLNIGCIVVVCHVIVGY